MGERHPERTHPPLGVDDRELEQAADLLPLPRARAGAGDTSRAADRRGCEYGFSVVAPIIVIEPSSMAGRRISCCALFHRWTSSTNRTVRNSVVFEWSITRRASETPELTAESCWKSAPTAMERRWASVVFPVPGGPHRMMEGRCPPSISFVSGLPSPSEMVVPDEFFEVARAHPRCEWSIHGGRVPFRRQDSPAPSSRDDDDRRSKAPEEPSGVLGRRAARSEPPVPRSRRCAASLSVVAPEDPPRV